MTEPEAKPEDETLRQLRSIASSIDSIRKTVLVIAWCIVVPFIAALIWLAIIGVQSIPAGGLDLTPPAPQTDKQK
jgi:hypothetical protein